MPLAVRLSRDDLKVQVWHPELWQLMQASSAGSVNINGHLFTYERINIANVYEQTSHARYLDDLGITNDVQQLEWTILVQSEPSQWQQLANFRDLYENAPIGYITLSSDGLITNVNKMVLAYLGYEREELVNNRNFKDLVVEKNDKPAEELLNALETARDQQTRLQMRGKNGQIIEVACNLSSRVNNEPTLEVGRCSVLDISDEVLKALAECCENILRVTDIMARFGGEEFVILLSDTNYTEGLAKAEELRQALAKLPIYLPDGTTFYFTVSFGVASLSAELDSIEKLLKAADTALYKAKQTGRNKVY
ncbi:GGDEF domain-containing protein [Aliidiomarina quisquiliarum]|uniref:GGDEF domain-containing protein n=1 Tax=Aliidiomarina quisquiliarum TaxID=2938947 RepID=UPI00208E2015|nr:GGDEF domain-containing protein [Aliidiomarina quisquiliarum]MCO4321267.1 GGDEF domain-containing protein [Aliidiomarina quisquiliarum]